MVATTRSSVSSTSSMPSEPARPCPLRESYHSGSFLSVMSNMMETGASGLDQKRSTPISANLVGQILTNRSTACPATVHHKNLKQEIVGTPHRATRGRAVDSC